MGAKHSKIIIYNESTTNNYSHPQKDYSKLCKFFGEHIENIRKDKCPNNISKKKMYY
jgi:hypothetical protein